MCHTAIPSFMPYRLIVFSLLKQNEDKHPVLFLGERKASYQLFGFKKSVSSYHISYTYNDQQAELN